MLKRARTMVRSRRLPRFLTVAIFAAYLCISTIPAIAQTTASSTATSSSVDSLNQQITAKSQQLSAVNDQITATQTKLNVINSQKKTLSTSVSSLNATISQLQLSITADKLNSQKLTLELGNLNGQLSQTQQAMTTSQTAVGEILRELQTTDNNQSLLTIFLREGDLSDSVQQLQNLQDLQDKLRSNIDTMATLSSSLSQTIDATNQKKASIELANKNATNQQAIVQDEKTQKATLLQQTKDSESTYQAQLTALQKERDTIGQETADLETQLRANFNSNVLPSSILGTLSYPVTNVVITQLYGATAFAQEAYSTHFHNGIDFGVPIGTPVFAAADGAVFAVGNNGRVQYGKYILIKHPNNLATIYAHLSRQIVTVGEQVTRGELIGYSGMTGDATGPHVHLGVYWAPSVSIKYFAGAGNVPIGVTVNPANYLP